MTVYYDIEGLAKSVEKSVPTIRKALSGGRITERIKDEKGRWLIDGDDPQVLEWRKEQDQGESAEEMRKELTNLRKRVKQAENRATREEKKRVKTLEQIAAMSSAITQSQALTAAAITRAIESSSAPVVAEVIDDEK